MSHVTRRQALIAGSMAGALVAVVKPATVQAADQPAMEAALSSLREAHRLLSVGSPDKGGHRVKAMQLVKDAIIQVEKGISYDRHH